MKTFKQYLTETELLELAMDAAAAFAQDMHQGQFRKGDGQPYAVHPQAVSAILKSFRVKDRVLLVAAWLHDTIEDTRATYNVIKKRFNKEVADLVRGVSSSKKEIEMVGKEVYLLNKMLKMSDNMLTLKLADRLHNVTDIMTMPAKTSEKTYNQTVYIIKGLREKRNLKQIHKKLIRAIEKYLNKL
jgi:GTP pyrophosphokinase/guanosine-3',5'-bis(diphosphate) 3'-pyrophosphohydrolase